MVAKGPGGVVSGVGGAEGQQEEDGEEEDGGGLLPARLFGPMHQYP